MTITNSPLRKRTKPAAGSSAAPRLPSTRERRPALAALAVLLIVGGAVLAGWLALRQSHTDTYLVVIDKVSEGSQIQSTDLGRLDLPTDGAGNFVPQTLAGDVVGSYALTDLVNGTVLVRAGMYGHEPNLQPDQARVGLDLRPDQYPPGLQVGDVVGVDLLSDVTDSNTPVLVTSGKVRLLQPAETGGGVVVDLVLARICSDEIASGSANGNVALAVLPVNDIPPAPRACRHKQQL